MAVRELGNAAGNPLGRAGKGCKAGQGEHMFTNFGLQEFVVPEGVYSVSVVCIGSGGGVEDNTYSGGGGALAYKNNIKVIPGQKIPVYVARPGGATWVDPKATGVPSGESSYFGDFCIAGGGLGGSISQAGGAVIAGDGGGSGGNGRAGSYRDVGGGGAGGYTGGGTHGMTSAGGSSSSATGGAASGGAVSNYGRPGGGVGPWGLSFSGAGSSSDGNPGSFGQPGRQVGGYVNGGTFGGGGGNNGGCIGGAGVVRIVWPGDTRQFPSTDVGTP